MYDNNSACIILSYPFPIASLIKYTHILCSLLYTNINHVTNNIYHYFLHHCYNIFPKEKVVKVYQYFSTVLYYPTLCIFFSSHIFAILPLLFQISSIPLRKSQGLYWEVDHILSYPLHPMVKFYIPQHIHWSLPWWLICRVNSLLNSIYQSLWVPM